SDVTDLAREVRCHRVDVVGKVFPSSGDALHGRLAAQLALGADLACYPTYLGGERAQLIDHRIDGFFDFQNLAAHVSGNLFRTIAIRHGDGNLGDVTHLASEIVGHRVDVIGQVLPCAGDAFDRGLS